METTHSIALHAPAMAQIVPDFEATMARQPDDPAGGPMHVDGAYSWYRKEHPETVTLAAMPSLVHQRSSQSDIFPPTWKDRVLFAPALRRTLRVFKR